MNRKPEELPAELAEVYRFATPVLEGDGHEAAGRDAIVGRWGDTALIEISIGLAAAQLFPLAKRALGHATSCASSPVEV